jgi:bifunctional non-homologous end joining protein LigD
MTTDGEQPFSEHSVFSGLTVEELKAGRDLGAEARERLGDLGAKARSLKVRDVGLMLAQTRDDPFTDPDWLFELKYDGYRLLGSREGASPQPVLLSRNGHDLTAVFPEIAHAVETLPYDDFVLDGEVVVHDDDGRPSFQRLQKRGRLTQRYDIRRATVELPATLYAFDLLALAAGNALRLRPAGAGRIRFTGTAAGGAQGDAPVDVAPGGTHQIRRSHRGARRGILRAGQGDAARRHHCQEG